MPIKKDPFELSISTEGGYSELLIKRPEYRELVTFSQNKILPIYNWFYYKEGFSRDLVWNLLNELKIPKDSKIIDPFCGTGTTLLACKQLGYNAIGFDILPLAVFVSNTKLQNNYDMKILKEKISEISSLKFGPSSLKWTQPGFIDIKKAFSRYARNDILFFKEKILGVEDEKIRNFLLLGLLSIVSEASNTKKDGGVIKIVKKRHLAPVRYLLKNRLKKMYKDLKRVPTSKGHAEAHPGDARNLPLEKEGIDMCITSPPYLNYVDYTKLYGLELSLLLDNKKELDELRKKSIRSHIGAEYKRGKKIKSEKLRETLDGVKEIPITSSRVPQIVEGYFEDMYFSLECLYRVLKEDAIAAFVVSNTCLPNITIDVDLILAEISEQVGFKPREILVANTRWCDVHGIRKERPVRESIIILEKST